MKDFRQIKSGAGPGKAGSFFQRDAFRNKKFGISDPKFAETASDRLPRQDPVAVLKTRHADAHFFRQFRTGDAGTVSGVKQSVDPADEAVLLPSLRFGREAERVRFLRMGSPQKRGEDPVKDGLGFPEPGGSPREPPSRQDGTFPSRSGAAGPGRKGNRLFCMPPFYSNRTGLLPAWSRITCSRPLHVKYKRLSDLA